MADNFGTNPGSGGATFAADDVGGGLLVPRVKVQCGPDGTGQDGWTSHALASAATVNSTLVKNATAEIGFIHVMNISASIRYLKLFQKASAPNVGTDTPAAVLPIPGDVAGTGFVLPIPDGLAWPTGLSYAITANPAPLDNTPIGANEVFLLMGYA